MMAIKTMEVSDKTRECFARVKERDKEGRLFVSEDSAELIKDQELLDLLDDADMSLIDDIKQVKGLRARGTVETRLTRGSTYRIISYTVGCDTYNGAWDFDEEMCYDLGVS